MKTAVMDEIMRQRDPALKEAVEASLAGYVARAFGKLGENVAEVKPDNLAGAAAARWLALSPEERANAGLMAPSHGLRENINAIVRERSCETAPCTAPPRRSNALVSRGYTNAERRSPPTTDRATRWPFTAPTSASGSGRGTSCALPAVDHASRTVRLEGADGRSVAWEPNRIAARAGGRRGVPQRGYRAARGRPHPLDAQRRRAGARQQRYGRGRGGARRKGDVPPGGRTDARPRPRRSAAAPCRPAPGPRPCTRSRAAPSTP